MIFNVKSLFGKPGSNEPFANRKSALQWLESLPADDPSGSHTRINEMLVQLTEAGPTQKEETARLEIIDALDHHIQPLQATLCEQYLRSPRMSQQVENRLWQAIHGYCTTISQLYFRHLQAQISNRELRHGESLALRLCLRGLFHLGHAIKWRLLRYGQPDSDMWSLLNAFYMIAESQGFENQPLTLYDGREYRCGSLFLRAQLLVLTHPGSLVPEQIEQLDRWLLEATEPMSLERSPRPERHHYFVDLAEPQGALPVSAVSFTATSRAWDMSTLLIQLQRSKVDLTQSSGSQVIDPTQRQKLFAAFSHAEKQWYPLHLGKLRKHPRTRASHHLSVVHGLPALSNVIRLSLKEPFETAPDDKAIKYTEMVDLQMYGFVTESTRTRQHNLRAPIHLNEPTERWESENESVNGYLVRYPGSSWMHLGSLVGLREEGSRDWKAAVVRRLIKTEPLSSMAGIEIIAAHPVPVTLQPIQADAQTVPAPPGPTAPSLNEALMTEPLQGTHFSLIIDSAHYARSRLYKFQPVSGQPFTYFRLGQIIEKGDLWIHAEALVIREEQDLPD